MIVAIHQPNYVPWTGYFAKILRSDVFVFLDHVEFSRGSYTQRAKTLSNGEPGWLTVPIRKSGRSTQAIRDTECENSSGWSRKHLRNLEQSYGKHPFFKEVFPTVESVLSAPDPLLATLNVRLVRGIADGLGAACRFVLSSEVAIPPLASSAMLAALVREVGGNRYLFGSGGAGYQEAELFAEAGISLVPQGFTPHPYPQRGRTEFVAGLSVLDALFNVGFERTRELLAQGLEGADDEVG